jgi:hypothetical protein
MKQILQVALIFIVAGCSKDNLVRTAHPLNNAIEVVASRTVSEAMPIKNMVWRDSERALLLNGTEKAYLLRTGSTTLPEFIRESKHHVMSFQEEGMWLSVVSETFGESEFLHSEIHEAVGCGGVRLLSAELPLVSKEETPPPAAPVHTSVSKLNGLTEKLAEVDAQRIRQSVTTLEEMGTRYHATDSGKAAAAKVEEIIKAEAGASAANWTFEKVTHNQTEQKSLVVKLKHTNADGPVTIIGSHLDSIRSNRNYPDQSIAPGADDDASGVATLVEVMRLMAKNSDQTTNPLEFHFYAAEEVGLVGSQEIALTYRNNSVNVGAMLQVDMNAWSTDANSTRIYLPSNYTHVNLRQMLKDLLNHYLGGDFEEGSIQGGTSDHQSWTLQGYASVFPFEHPVNYNKSIHSPADTVSTINNFALSARFAKLIYAFIHHQAGITGTQSLNEEKLSADIVLNAQKLSASQFNLAVATAESVKRMSMCALSDATEKNCTSQIYEVPADRSGKGRAFFGMTYPFAFKEGVKLRFIGYDQADLPVVSRSVKASTR